MSDNIERILDKLDEMQERQVKHSTRLIRIENCLNNYNEQLKLHMKRSDSLEKQVAYLYRIKYYIAGGLAVSTAIITVFFNIIKAYLGV